MSKLKNESNNLPSLQRAVVLHLAKNEPQTKNETVTAIKKSYKPTWLAFKSLKKKKLIKETGIKEYNNRKFPTYWLTDEGIIISMLEGADKALLLEESKRFFPDAKIVHCFLEIIQHMNPIMIKLAGNIINNKGKMDFADLMNLLISDVNYESDEKAMKKIVEGLKKYPEEYEKAKIIIHQMINQLKQLISDQ
ncbi:hypothetical protein ACFLRN_05760 [Thermoproteota archaeon]